MTISAQLVAIIGNAGGMLEVFSLLVGLVSPHNSLFGLCDLPLLTLFNLWSFLACLNQRPNSFFPHSMAIPNKFVFSSKV